MPPAIIAAAISIGASAAAAASIISVSTAMVITIGATVAGALLTKSKVPSLGNYTSQQERKQVLRSSTSPMVVIYGKTVVSGTLFFAEEESGDQDDGEWVNLAVTIAGHEINRVTNIYLGDENITAFGPDAEFEIHNNRQTVDPFMLRNCPSWKEDMIGKGICWARISLKFSVEKFPAGLPNIKFEVEGKKVYNPLTKVTEWSANAALCIRDYYKTECGVLDSDINDDQFISAMSICNQIVTNGPNNVTRRRYEINGSFDLTDAQSSVLDDLHMACAGEPTYMAGRHGIIVGAWAGQSPIDLHEGQIVSDIKIIPEASYGEKLNQVTGTFLDPLAQYTETDYPAVKVDAYIEQDGGEFTDDLKLRFVANEYQAQQLAQIKINRTRLGRSFQFKMNMSGYQYRPGSFVNLFVPSLGINNQLLRITDWSMSADGGVDITLRQETEQVWLGIIGAPIERPDLTDLPAAGVDQPRNLLYTVDSIGEVVQGVLSWSNPSAVANNIVTIRQNGKVISTESAPGQSLRLTGLPKGAYEAGVVAVGFMGNRSNEAMLIINVEAPPAPSSVEVAQGYFEFTLKPRLAGLVNVSTQFDFWTSEETKLPNTSTAIVEAQATRAGMGTTWTSSGLKQAHTYYWYIRTINAFGTSQFVEVAAQSSTDLTGVFEHLDEELKKTDGFKDLESGMADISTEVAGVKQQADATAQTVQTLKDVTVKDLNDKVNTLNTVTIPKINQDVAAVTTKANNNATAISKEVTDRTNAVSAEASARAQAILNESTERKSGITQVQTNLDTATDSLSQQIAQVSAGTGVQFDSLNIWYFDNGPEGWLSQGNVAPVINNGWIRPANSASSYLVSPTNLGVSAQSYAYAKMRVRRVGTSAWKGKLYWITAAGSFVESQSVAIPEPIWVNGIATIDFPDIPWGPTAATKIYQIRLDMGIATTASAYYELDWVAIGRPSPGAGMAALERETKARTDAISAEALERTTLASQMRGDYAGNDIAGLSTGLLYQEKVARTTADSAEVVARQALESKVDANRATAVQEVKTLTDKQNSQASSITQLQTDLGGKASNSALQALDSKVTGIDGRVTAQNTAITNLQSGLNATNTEVGKKADTTALNALSTVVTGQGNDITANSNSITTLTTNIEEINNRGNNLALNGSFEQDFLLWTKIVLPAKCVIDRPSGWTPKLGLATLRMLAAGSSTIANNNTEVGQYAYLQEGKTYRVACWIKKSADYVERDSSNCKIGLASDTSGATIGYSHFTSGTPGEATWRQVFFDYKLITSQRMYFYMRANLTSGSIWFDNFTVEDISDAIAIESNSTAIQTLDSKVTTTNGVVTSQGQAITSLRNDLTATNAEVTKKADATALNALSNTVTQQGKDISSQGTSITQLTNNVTTSSVVNDLLANSGFEAEGLGWQMQGLTSAISFIKPGGRFSASPTAVLFTKPSAAALLRQVFTLKAGRTYRCSCWTIFSADAAGVQWGNTKLRLGNMDTGAILAVKEYSNGAIVNDKWTETSFDYTVPGNTDLYGDISVSAFFTTGTLRLDEVHVVDITDLKVLNATSDAVTVLQSTVTQQGNTITSQSGNITTLQNKVGDLFNAGANLMVDGSFEQLTPNSVTPANVTMEPTTAAFRTGKQSARLRRVKATGVGNEDIVYGNPNVNQYFQATEGQVFYLECWFRRDPEEVVTPIGAAEVALGLWLNNSTTAANSWPVAIRARLLDLNNTWVKYSGYITVPANFDRARIWFTFSSRADNLKGITVLADDLVLRDATEAQKVQTGLDATSSAVTALTSRVDVTETSIASVSSQATALDNSLTTLSASSDSLLPNSRFAKGIQFWQTQGATGNTAIWNETAGENGSPGVVMTRTSTAATATAIIQPANTKISATIGDAYILRIRARSTSGGGQFLLRFIITTTTGTTSNQDTYVDLTTSWATYEAKLGPIVGATFDSFQVALYKHANVGVAVVSSVDLINVTDAIRIDATSSALTSLDSKVTQQGNTLTSQGSSITNLQNSVTGLQSSKADASALNALTSTVTQQGKDITSTSGLVTDLAASVQFADKDANNMMPNASFEGGMMFWGTNGTAGTNFNIETTGGVNTTTPQCLRMYQRTGSAVLVYQNLILKVGRTYRVSAWAKYSSGSSVPDNNTKLRVGNSANVPIVDVAFLVNGAVFTTWTEFSKEITITGSDQRCQVSVGCSALGTGYLYIDDVAVVDVTDVNMINASATAIQTLQNTVTNQGGTIASQGEAVTKLENNISSVADVGANMIANSRFLKDMGMWDVVPGATANSITWASSTGEGQPGVTIVKNSGTSPYLRTPSSNLKGWPVLPGRRYRITVRAKGTAGTYNLLCRLYRVTVGGATAYEDKNFVLTSSWTTITADYAMTPSDVDSVYIHLYNHPVNGTIVIDSVTLFDITDSLNNSANASAITGLTTRVTKTETDIQAQATAITQVDSRVGVVDGRVTNLSTTVTNNQSSTNQQITQVKSTADGAAAGVQTLSASYADLNGKINASWGVKVETETNGVKTVAGIQLNNGTNGSQFLIKADKFAIYNTTSKGTDIPFQLVNGQTYIKEAFIQDASIGSAKFAREISSDNYTWNDDPAKRLGWAINRNGNAIFADVQVGGGIFATWGYFRGDLQANSGFFNGEIRGGSGWFNGTIYARYIQGDVVSCSLGNTDDPASNRRRFFNKQLNEAMPFDRIFIYGPIHASQYTANNVNGSLAIRVWKNGQVAAQQSYSVRPNMSAIGTFWSAPVIIYANETPRMEVDYITTDLNGTLWATSGIALLFPASGKWS